MSTRQYDAIKVISEKWEKRNPGTLADIYQSTLRDSQRTGFLLGSLAMILLLGSIFGFLWANNLLDTSERVAGAYLILCVLLVLGIIIAFMEDDNSDSLTFKKGTLAHAFQHLLNEIHPIVRKYHKLEWYEKPPRYESLLFHEIKDWCEAELRSIAHDLVVWEDAATNRERGDEACLKVIEFRSRLKDLHRMFTQAGLASPELGSYFPQKEEAS